MIYLSVISVFRSLGFAQKAIASRHTLPLIMLLLLIREWKSWRHYILVVSMFSLPCGHLEITVLL